MVNYVLSNNIYAIINCHHEESWLIPDYAHRSSAMAQLTKLWEQIAGRFKDTATT